MSRSPKLVPRTLAAPAVLCLLAATPLVAFAQPPAADATLQAEVRRLVDDLDAPQRRRRIEAEQALIEAGPDVLPLLPEANGRLSAEAGRRLDRVRERLTAQRAASESSAITVRLDDVSDLGEALEAISRDSGVEFEWRGDTDQAVTPVAQPLPFWHAVDHVLDQAGLDIDFYGGDRQTLELVARQEDRPSRVDSAAYAGVYRIEPTAVTSRRDLNQPSLSGLNVNLEIAWEPKLTPIGLTIPIDQLSGVLDDEAALVPQDSGGKIDVATSRELAFSEFFLPMKLPAGNPREIRRMSGVIRAMLPGKRQQFELDLADPIASQKIDAMTVRIEAVRRTGPLTEVRIGVSLEEADRSLESHRQWIFENDAFLKRSDGSRVDHLGYEVYRQTPDGVGVGYLFDLEEGSDGITFVYESPTAVVNNEVSFVLQDIPLP